MVEFTLTTVRNGRRREEDLTLPVLPRVGELISTEHTPLCRVTEVTYSTVTGQIEVRA